jgi:hypothetical protein
MICYNAIFIIIGVYAVMVKVVLHAWWLYKKTYMLLIIIQFVI